MAAPDKPTRAPWYNRDAARRCIFDNERLAAARFSVAAAKEAARGAAACAACAGAAGNGEERAHAGASAGAASLSSCSSSTRSAVARQLASSLSVVRRRFAAGAVRFVTGRGAPERLVTGIGSASRRAASCAAVRRAHASRSACSEAYASSHSSMSKFEERGLLAAAAGADCSQLSCRNSMARSSPGNYSCALAVTELWFPWRVLLQKRWAYASRLSSSPKFDDIAYMNWNGTQSLLGPTSLTPAAVSSFLMPSTANVLELAGRPKVLGHKKRRSRKRSD